MTFPLKRRRLERIALILALSCAVGHALAAEPARPTAPPAERVRIETASGSMVVRGPVVTRDGLVVFHTLDGKLSSVPERLVRRVVPLGNAEGAGQKAQAPLTTEPRPPGARAEAGEFPKTTGEPGRFTNADLPEPMTPPETGTSALTNEDLAARAPADRATYTNAQLPAIEDPAAGQPSADPGTETADGSDPAQEIPNSEDAPAMPTEGDRAPGEATIEELDAKITLAEQEENLYYRLLVCAQNGLPLNGKDCHPGLGLRPKPSASPSLSERSLMAKMQAAHQQAEEAQEERARRVAGTPQAGIAAESADPADASSPP